MFFSTSSFTAPPPISPLLLLVPVLLRLPLYIPSYSSSQVIYYAFSSLLFPPGRVIMGVADAVVVAGAVVVARGGAARV